MVYKGSKRRMAKYILPYIYPRLKPGMAYIEPFVGGANMIDKVEWDWRIGIDNNEYLITMFQELQEGRKFPSTVTEEEYYFLKRNRDEDKGLSGFAGFNCAFASTFFRGYARNKKGSNYAERGVKNLARQLPKIKDVEFVCSDYREYDYPPHALIYCDPPYANTEQYHCQFDHDEFYDWCRMMASRGYDLLISEYEMPPDFELLVEVNLINSINNRGAIKKGKTRKPERLFLLRKK